MKIKAEINVSSRKLESFTINELVFSDAYIYQKLKGNANINSEGKNFNLSFNDVKWISLQYCRYLPTWRILQIQR